MALFVIAIEALTGQGFLIGTLRSDFEIYLSKELTFVHAVQHLFSKIAMFLLIIPARRMQLLRFSGNKSFCVTKRSTAL